MRLVGLSGRSRSCYGLKRGVVSEVVCGNGGREEDSQYPVTEYYS